MKISKVVYQHEVDVHLMLTFNAPMDTFNKPKNNWFLKIVKDNGYMLKKAIINTKSS